MAWAVLSLLNRQWHLHNKQEEPLQSKALPQVLKLLAPRGALAQYDASGLFPVIGSLQVYKSDSICPDYALHFPAGLVLLTLPGGFMHLHSLVAAVGCVKWKLPARNSETEESVQLCKASENFGKCFWTLCSIPPSHLLQKKDPQFLRSDISFGVFLLEVFLGEPKLAVYGGINRTAAVEC